LGEKSDSSARSSKKEIYAQTGSRNRAPYHAKC
jgi:hypothetical protein